VASIGFRVHDTVKVRQHMYMILYVRRYTTQHCTTLNRVVTENSQGEGLGGARWKQDVTCVMPTSALMHLCYLSFDFNMNLKITAGLDQLPH
jgi:hypothetical protein